MREDLGNTPCSIGMTDFIAELGRPLLKNSLANPFWTVVRVLINSKSRFGGTLVKRIRSIQDQYRSRGTWMRCQ